jgi:acyl-CoA hydrolase
VGKTSLTLSHTFYKKNSKEGERFLTARAEVTVVAFDEQVHQKTGLPLQLLETLKRLDANFQT